MPQGGNIRRAEARGDVTVVSKDQNASWRSGRRRYEDKDDYADRKRHDQPGQERRAGERVVVKTATGDARVESGVTAHDPAKSAGTAHNRVRVLIVPAKDAKGAPTNTMTFEEAPSHPP